MTSKYFQVFFSSALFVEFFLMDSPNSRYQNATAISSITSKNEEESAKNEKEALRREKEFEIIVEPSSKKADDISRAKKKKLLFISHLIFALVGLGICFSMVIVYADKPPDCGELTTSSACLSTSNTIYGLQCQWISGKCINPPNLCSVYTSCGACIRYENCIWCSNTSSCVETEQCNDTVAPCSNRLQIFGGVCWNCLKVFSNS